ncbi:nuclear transport factor 2 family protein [Aquimarina sp. MMG016]|uniref:YybH family protein n=1 Tax=Aquimarina sp. MMG016 TaxID=2822690 RepID=UPI001B3A432E|nr:nuclear transport factor 2 family protein [Aquimarina sp. MMG016]MBQ4819279.1 nuclear transport factor 2 family protein [Aquimarina sp. MMG016]
MKILYSVLLICLSCNISTAQTYIGDKNEIEDILQNLEDFSRYVMSSSYQKIGNSYTDDAKIFPNNTKILAGKPAIINYWTLPEGVNIIHHKIMPDEIRIVDNTAYDYGYYEGVTKKIDGKEVTWKGKYVIVWKKVNTEWKIYLDIWNGVK